MTFTLPQSGEELSRVLAVLDDLEILEARGLLTIDVNDLGELRLAPTQAGIAAVREEEERHGGRGD